MCLDSDKVVISDRKFPFNNDSIIRIDSDRDSSKDSLKSINYHLEALWQKIPNSSESLNYLIVTNEWEKVLFFLRVQISSCNDEVLPEWIFKILSTYEKKHSKLYHTCIHELEIVTRWIPEEKIYVGDLAFNIAIRSEEYVEDYVEDYLMV
jgi:hypothetical protein